MKQSVNLERWSSDDFVSKSLRELPTSVSVGGKVSTFYMHYSNCDSICVLLLLLYHTNESRINDLIFFTALELHNHDHSCWQKSLLLCWCQRYMLFGIQKALSFLFDRETLLQQLHHTVSLLCMICLEALGSRIDTESVMIRASRKCGSAYLISHVLLHILHSTV